MNAQMTIIATDTQPLRVSPPLWETVTLCLIAGVASLATAYYLVFVKSLIIGDAMSRVMNAYYIFYRGHLHFGAVGFVWNPFPSLIELPITLFHHIWPSLVTVGFAGNIASSLFSCVSVFYLNRILFNFQLHPTFRVVLSLIFIFNPMILFYSAIGMSDGMLMACLLGAIDGVMTYLQRNRLESLASGAIWLAAAFMFRYEAVPFFAMTGVAVAISIKRLHRTTAEVEAMFILYAVPMVYSVMAWMFLNWLIMKNPLYFLISPYGNVAQIGTGSYATQVLTRANHHFVSSILLAGHFSFLFWPCLIGIAYGILQQFRFNPDPRWLPLLGAIVSVPLFQAGMIFMNKSAAWSRFFIEYIPFGFLLLGLMVSSMPQRKRTFAAILILFVSVAGNYGTWRALHSPVLGNGDWYFISNIGTHERFYDFKQEIDISKYISAHPDMIVLADTFDAYGIIARVQSHQQTVITSDIDFNSVLQNPRGRVNAILVSEPIGVSTLNAINRAYPSLWSGGLQWAKLIVEFPGPSHFRLYAVTKQAP